MTFKPETYLGNNPVVYARAVLEGCNITEPPVDQETITDFLNLEILEVTDDEINEYEFQTGGSNFMLQHLKVSCAGLQQNLNGGRSKLLLLANQIITRKRLSVFHECGHALLPWHKDTNYFCLENDIKLTGIKLKEAEAYKCGAEILMPYKMLVPDILDLVPSIQSIKKLKSRYIASFEATAIRYAYTHPGICAIVMVEPSSEKYPKIQGKSNPDQLILTPRSFTKYYDFHKKFPLSVKYSVTSHRFPFFIKPGIGINDDNPIFGTWLSDEPYQGELPISLFGQKGKRYLNAECIPFGNTGMVLVLLWLPSYQMYLDYTEGLISCLDA
jgi:hypothetical protein